jgi:hypothetical protein
MDLFNNIKHLSQSEKAFANVTSRIGICPALCTTKIERS